MSEARSGSGSRAFGKFLLDAERGCLLADGVEIRLRPKTFAILAYLVANPGRLVSKDELLRAVWRGAMVTDDVLVQSVGELRRALGEEGAACIRTLPRRGYRFDAEVCSTAPAHDVMPEAAAPLAPAGRPRRWPLRAAMLALLLAVAAGAGLLIQHNGRAQSSIPEAAATPVQEKPVIAILPFNNLSADATRQYFVDGMTEYLIDALGRFSSLTVVAPGEETEQHDTAAAPDQIAPVPGMQYQLEGGVQLTAQRVHVNARLVDARTRVVLWSDEFDEPLDEMLLLQEKLVQQISAQLARQVASFEMQRVAATRPDNFQAYEYVLRARSVMNDGREGLANARQLLTRAQELDPGYAAAESSRALTYLISVGLGWAESRTRELEKAQAAARRALELDQDNVEAHVVLGHVYLLQSAHDMALAAMERALAINPNDSLALEGHGQALLWDGQTEAAIAELEHARRIRPGMKGPELLALALGYYLMGRYHDAIAVVNRAPPPPEVIVDPALDVLLLLAACHAQLGNVEATAQLVEWVRAAGPPRDIQAFGSWLRQERDRQRLREGLVKAGLEAELEAPTIYP